MSLPTYYAGPGKCYYTMPGTATVYGFQPRDTNGQINLSVDESTATIGTAMFGDVFETLNDIQGKISLTPFDNWTLLPALFPAFLGVTTSAIAGGAAGALAIGTMPHDPTNAGAIYPCGVFAADGSTYNFVRGAIIKPPVMTFCPGEKLYGDIEISGLGQLAISGAVGLPGAEGFLMSSGPASSNTNPITEPGANADPDTTGFTVTAANFGQTFWTAAWGNIFTGMQAEDGWQLVPDVKYNTIPVQKLSRITKLASARFMIKGRVVGPTHTALLAKILGSSGTGGHTSGGILTEFSGGAFAPADFVITSASGTRTVTLKNAEIKTAPFTFGGTKLRTGEIGFVQSLTISASAASPSLIFSA